MSIVITEFVAQSEAQVQPSMKVKPADMDKQFEEGNKQ
jgi:hypothetical protein